jgi:predicted ATPase
VGRVLRALAGIEVHVPFASLPRWVDRAIGGGPSMRTSSSRAQSERLEILGGNLATVFRRLREGSRWDRTMGYVRLGLGDDIADVLVKPTLEDGLEIWLCYDAFSAPVPARSLSDGTLGYLAFVALLCLPTRRSLLAFDEPENQLHPAMAARVGEFFQAMSREQSVLVATHSDRMLDALKYPADSVVLCSLGEGRQTSLKRPNRDALDEWLKDYRGLGEIRSAGHEDSIMTQSEPGE